MPQKSTNVPKAILASQYTRAKHLVRPFVPKKAFSASSLLPANPPLTANYPMTNILEVTQLRPKFRTLVLMLLLSMLKGAALFSNSRRLFSSGSIVRQIAAGRVMIIGMRSFRRWIHEYGISTSWASASFLQAT